MYFIESSNQKYVHKGHVPGTCYKNQGMHLTHGILSERGPEHINGIKTWEKIHTVIAPPLQTIAK